MAELLAIPFSPWSEKARWALDVRQVAYRYRHYAPLVGEPALRLRLRKWRGPVTVPVLTSDDGQILDDSAKIARWADARGDGPTLFPVGREREVDHFIELSERGLSAGRALSLRRLRRDREALREMVPKGLRRSLGSLAPSLGGFGVDRTLRKYGARREDAAAQERALVDVLSELRAALGAAPDGAPKTLLGAFTFADVAMAQVLAFIHPPAFGLRLAPASRRSFEDAALAERYADLVAWRDAIYDRYRPRG